RLPAAGDVELGVGGAVAGGAHQGVETRPDLRVGVEIFPERQTEALGIGGPAGTDVAEQGAPGVGHAAADAVEVEADPQARVEQAAGGLIQGEPAGGPPFEHALADELPKPS